MSDVPDFLFIGAASDAVAHFADVDAVIIKREPNGTMRLEIRNAGLRLGIALTEPQAALLDGLLTKPHLTAPLNGVPIGLSSRVEHPR